jgi:hypothetical protein
MKTSKPETIEIAKLAKVTGGCGTGSKAMSGDAEKQRSHDGHGPGAR